MTRTVCSHCTIRSPCRASAQSRQRSSRGLAVGAASARHQIVARLADGGGGTGVLDRPDLDIGRESTPEADPGLGAGDFDRRKNSGGGNYRLLLVDSDKHTEGRVVAAVTTVVPGVTETQAANCFHTARQLGMAIITSCLKEHAEFYAQQLFQRGCRARIEPDTTTL